MLCTLFHPFIGSIDMTWIAKLIGKRTKYDAAAADAALRRKTEALSNIQILLDGQQYALDDMTLRTFRITPYDGQLIARQKFLFDFVISRGDDEEATRFTGHGYVKSMESGVLEAIFRQPQPYYQQILIDVLGLQTPVAKSSHAA